MLRARPARDIQRAVRIDARFPGDRAAVRRGQLGVAAHVLLELPVHGAPPLRRGDECAAIEPLHIRAEVHEIREVGERVRRAAAVLVREPQRIDDERGVAIPVKEVIRIRIVGGEDG